jgi:protein ImuB
MDRMACLDLPAFPLQLLRKRQPESGFATVVVEEDKPLARVLWACERARALGILPGHRYGQALSLAAELRAGVVPPPEIAAGVERMAQVLRALSPDVEPCQGEPGVFWLSGSGLRQIFPSASAWGRAIFAAAAEAGFAAGVAVGFTRFGTYAVARSAAKLSVFRDGEAEARVARAVPLDRLSLDPDLRDAVARLGVHTLGGYLKLPPGGVLLRFGREAFRLHELAAGARWDPLRADHPLPPLEVRNELDEPESDATRLLFLVKIELGKLLAKLAERKLALASLELVLSFSRAFGEQRERLAPAEPTLDERLLTRLIHLRLEAAPARAAVMGLALSAEAVPARASQLALFLQGPRRDLHAASEALAQLRAELGDAGVRKAVLRDEHLPEAQFSWEPVPKLEPARPRTGLPRVLVRRIHAQPMPVQGRGGGGNVRNDGWLISGLEHGSVLRFHGPYLASGGWWMAPQSVEDHDEPARDYGFAETRRGECLWLFYDRARRQWFIQGAVE